MSTEEPPVTFSTFLVSLASTALANLGEVDSGAGAQPIPVDLRLARQTLALLDVLAEKTRGNLDEEEARLLDALQGELRGKYAEKSRG